MRYFYVDYENVQSIGLEGLDRLTEQDKVTVMYSNHADSIKIDIVKQLQNTKAEVSFVEVDTGTPNALDFQLITLLFIELNEEDEFLIISKDTGFDAAIKMAKRQNHNNVRRINNIQNDVEVRKAMSEMNITDELISATEDDDLSEDFIFFEDDQKDGAVLSESVNQISIETPYSQIETIISDKCGDQTCKKFGKLIITGLKTSGNKNQFYQFFRKNLGDEEGGNLYRSIRTKFDDMRALL